MHVMPFPMPYIQRFLSDRLPLIIQRKDNNPNY